VLDHRGQDGREAVWAHPDLMPGAEDLDDPASYAAGDADAFDISALDSTPTYDPDDDSPGSSGHDA
jgi:hypothetical protein